MSVNGASSETTDVNWIGGFGIRFLLGGGGAQGRFALVEHPLKPRALAAPLHRHEHEDEYSFVLRGRVGAKLGGRIVYGEAGDLILKPRGEWHTFWNAGDREASLLEIISPAGFEDYFRGLVDLLVDGSRPDPAELAPLAARHGLELDYSTIPALCQEFGLRFG